MYQLTARLPTSLALLVGLILALALWKRHPRVSLLLAIGFAILLVVPLASVPLTYGIVTARREHGAGLRDVNLVLGIFQWLQAALLAIGYALLTWGALAGRPRPGSGV